MHMELCAPQVVTWEWLIQPNIENNNVTSLIGGLPLSCNIWKKEIMMRGKMVIAKKKFQPEKFQWSV